MTETKSTIIHWYEEATPVDICCEHEWEANQVVVFPNVRWGADLGILAGGREDAECKRKPGGSWSTQPISNEVQDNLSIMYVQITSLFGLLYPTLGPPAQTNFTWRPCTIRGDMHSDKGTPKRKGEERIITGFMNTDSEPRKWKFGCGREVDFQPGTLWIFRAEKVPHQVVYGRCAIQYNWVLM